MKAILGHKNMDFDCFASMIAARKLHSDFNIVFPDNIERMVKNYIENEKIPFDYMFASDVKNKIDEIIIVDNNNVKRTGLKTEIIENAKILKIYDHHQDENIENIQNEDY